MTAAGGLCGLHASEAAFYGEAGSITVYQYTMFAFAGALKLKIADIVTIDKPPGSGYLLRPLTGQYLSRVSPGSSHIDFVAECGAMSVRVTSSSSHLAMGADAVKLKTKIADLVTVG